MYLEVAVGTTHPSLVPPQMSSLCRRLDELWEENQGCVVLFTWIQFLKEEAIDFLGIQSPLEVIRGGSKAGGERRKTDPAATGTEFIVLFVWRRLQKLMFLSNNFLMFFFSLLSSDSV